MRLLAAPVLLLVAVSAKVCDSDGQAKMEGAATSGAVASADASASAEAKLTLARPRIGGAVVTAGDFSVEARLHQSGLVEALVSDAHGKLVSEGVKLSAGVRARGGAAEKLELGFAPSRGRFEAKAKAQLAPGPVELALEVAGKTHTAKLDAAVVLPAPRLGGHMLIAGAFSVEVQALPSGEVRAFVADHAGAELSATSDVKISAIVSTKSEARERIELAFDAPRACFSGKAKAGVVIAPGPLELLVDAKVGGGAGRLEGIALSAEAAHGGQVVAVGDFSVELLAKGPAISAFVLDANGKAHVAGDLDLRLDVGLAAATELALKWDAPSASYVGQASGKLDLGLQPIRISLVAAGKAFVGAVASLNAAAKIDAKMRGELGASAALRGSERLDGSANAKLAADAKAKLDQGAKAGASIKLAPPKVDVSAKKSATAGAKASGGKAEAKASAGFSFGAK